LILSHLLADLNNFGTSDTPVAPTMEHSGERNRLLMQSARMVTNAFMSTSNDGFDTTSAIKQWRCLRHLTAVIAAVVTKSGYVPVRSDLLMTLSALNDSKLRDSPFCYGQIRRVGTL
jgi:hypothetical protein